MQAPEGVSFNDSDFVGYSFINDPFSVTPSGMESFNDQQTRITRFTPENTDPELGTGERQRATTTTLRTEQDYVSDQEWTVRYTLTNRYDDDELSTDSDETQTEVDRGYLTTLVVTVTNGTTATRTFTVSDSFRFGIGAIPGEEQSDDPWAIPESWMDTAEQSVNTAADTPTSSSSGSQDSTASTNGSGFFIAAGYSTSFTKTTEKVTLDDGTAATRTTNSFNWSSSFSMRIGGSYNSSQAGSSTTDSVISTDQTSTNSSDNLTAVSFTGTDSTGTTGVTASVDTSTVIASDPYSGFQPVAKGQYQAFAMGSVAAAFSYTTTVPVNPLNLLSSTFSASAAFAVSALAGSNSNSSIKGDLNQSSGSEDDDTDEHLRIHVDNSDKASASAGFSFWFGIKVGNDSASSDSEVVDSPVNTTRSDSDEANPVSFTAEPSTAPESADGEESNTESQAPKPGRQSASDMIQDNPTGIQLSLNTSNSSNVGEDFSFSEKTRSSHGYSLNSDSDEKQTSSDVHFVVALGTERTDLEFGNSKSSGTDVSMVRDQYSHNVVPGNLYHTAHFTDTYSEHTRSNEAFQYSMNADTPVTNTVFLKERFDGSSRDYRSGELGTAIVLKTERYFNTTDRDDGPTGGSDSLNNTTSDETPIYLYVESFTGAGGTIEYNRIEETPPYPIATTDASDNPVTPSDAIVNTQPLEQQRSVEDILAEYGDRATKIARWQARLNEPIDPGMRTYLEGLIASEQAILNTLATNAMNAGATQSQLNQINQEAQAGAENDPVVWQEGDGGDSVLLAAYIGFQFGKVQGILNSFNGVTDIGTGMINQGINVTNPLGWALGTNSQIPLVDWSRGRVTDEDPELHKWSKELGGNGIVLLASIIPFLPKGFKSGGLVPVDIRRLTYSSQKECAFANELMEMGTFNMAKYLENPAIVELKKNGVMVVQWGSTALRLPKRLRSLAAIGCCLLGYSCGREKLMIGIKQIYATLLELETVHLWNCVLGNDKSGALFHLDTESRLTDVLRAAGDEFKTRAADFLGTRIPQYYNWLATQDEEKQDTVAAMSLPYVREIANAQTLMPAPCSEISLSDLENDLLNCFRRTIEDLRQSLTNQDDAWAIHQLQFMHNIPTLIRQSPVSINSPHVYFCDIEWPAYANWCVQSSLANLYEPIIERIQQGLARVIAGYKAGEKGAGLFPNEQPHQSRET